MALVLDGDNGIVGVLVTNADGDVTIDTNTFFVDADNNRVGIGTTSPGETLEVNGNMFINVASGNPNLTIKTAGAGNNPFARLQADSTYWDILGVFSSADDPLHFQYGGSDKMVITNSGNVGIGETNPAEKLEISGNIKLDTGATQYIDFKSGTSGAINYRIYNGIGWNSDAMLIYDHTNDATILTIEPGKLGINRGSSSLTQAFEVNGGAWISGNVGINETDPQAPLDFGVTNPAQQVLLLRQNGNSRTGFSISNEYGVRAFGPADASSTGALFAVGEMTSGTNYLGDLFTVRYDGNVGIGTSGPQQKLQVKESSTSTTSVHYPISVGGTNHVANYAAGIGFDPEGYGSRNKMALVVEGNGQGYSRGKFHFLMNAINDSSEATLSNAKLTLMDNGNVGINVTSPARHLHIDGAIRLDSDQSFQNSGTGFGGGIVKQTPAYTEYQYTWSGNADHDTYLYCASYFMAEVTYTSHQTNGGSDIHRLIKGKWANNHTTHTWTAYHDSGNTWALGLNISATDHSGSGGGSPNGRLHIDENYGSGSYAHSTLTIKCYYGTPSNITHT